MIVLLYLALAAGATGVVWWGSLLLETSSQRLAAYYGLSPLVQGAIIAAIGSSFPELSGAVLATLLHGSFELGVAAIVGSAIFNILVIPGIAGLVGERLGADRTLVYKDAQFYVTSVAVLLLAFAFALIYNPVEGERWVGEVDRLIALIPLSLYGLYLFLQHQDAKEYEKPPRPEGLHAGREWGRLALSLVVIVVAVEGLVRAALGLGEALDTPPFLWGLTIIAAGTSLPDAFVSIRAARRGNPTVSLGNVLGSNVFDLLVALPIGIFLAGSSRIDFSVAAPMMGALTLATTALFAMLRTRLELARWEAVVLLVLYALFVVWMVLETLGITRFVFGTTPP